MMKKLQKDDKGKIVICNLGNFYIAIGRDAVLLNNLIGLKVSCIETGICKVGFPINSLEKYTGKLIEKRYGFIVYYFDQEKEEIKPIISCRGEKKNELEYENINCFTCFKNTKKHKEPDKYERALAKLYEEELENGSINDNKSETEKIDERKRKRKIWFQNKNKKTNYH